MNIISGVITPNTRIRFIVVTNSPENIIGLQYTTETDNSGNYNISLYTGVYDVTINNRFYRNINIDKNGSLNEFLENANGGNL